MLSYDGPNFPLDFSSLAKFDHGNDMSASLLIRDMPSSERPRERMSAHGAESLHNAELIAILLRTGIKGVSAVDVGRNLLAQFGTLEQLAKAKVDDLVKVKGIGRDKAIGLRAAFTLAQRMARELQQEAALLDSPDRIVDLLREQIRAYPVESLHVVMLNARHRLIRVEKVSDGTLDMIMVHPREVFRSAIAANAASIVLVHNHPSGDPNPSEADVTATRDLIRAGQLLKINVQDHLIIGTRTESRPRDYTSLRELGHFYT